HPEVRDEVLRQVSTNPRLARALPISVWGLIEDDEGQFRGALRKAYDDDRWADAMTPPRALHWAPMRLYLPEDGRLFAPVASALIQELFRREPEMSYRVRLRSGVDGARRKQCAETVEKICPLLSDLQSAADDERLSVTARIGAALLMSLHPHGGIHLVLA